MLQLVDWLVLGALLLGPVALGLWRGRRGRGGEEEGEGEKEGKGKSSQGAAALFLFAGKSLSTLTVGLSLLASNLSGITLLGYPAEVYRYGTQFWLVAVGAVLATVAVCAVYMPVLHGLQLTSPYEYLELRFNKRVRRFTSVMYTARLLLHLPLVLYVPALAFNQVSGVSIHIVAPLLASACILCTIIGGLRTVAMTGSLQLGVMLVATLALLLTGLADVGDPAVVFQRLRETDRLEFLNLDPSPMTRTTFWSATFGGAFFWLQMLAVQPNSVQRYLAMPQLSAARRTAYLQCAGLVVTISMTCFLGAVLFAKYGMCDPLLTKEVKRADQLVAFMVGQASSRLPGLAGLFLAGLFSAAMGNLAASLNSLSGTLYTDLVSGWLPERLQRSPGAVMRVLGVLIGAWAAALVLLVERMGGLVQVAMSLGSITSGTLLGLFSLGMFFPRSNAAGAMTGAALSLTLTAGLVGGQQAAVSTGTLYWPHKPSSVHSCLFNVSVPTAHPSVAGEVLWPLRLSYLWLVLLGCGVTLLGGVLGSALGSATHPVDPALLVPFLRPRDPNPISRELRPIMA